MQEMWRARGHGTSKCGAAIVKPDGIRMDRRLGVLGVEWANVSPVYNRFIIQQSLHTVVPWRGMTSSFHTALGTPLGIY